MYDLFPTGLTRRRSAADDGKRAFSAIEVACNATAIMEGGVGGKPIGEARIYWFLVA